MNFDNYEGHHEGFGASLDPSALLATAALQDAARAGAVPAQKSMSLKEGLISLGIVFGIGGVLYLGSRR